MSFEPGSHAAHDDLEIPNDIKFLARLNALELLIASLIGSKARGAFDPQAEMESAARIYTAHSNNARAHFENSDSKTQELALFTVAFQDAMTHNLELLYDNLRGPA